MLEDSQYETVAEIKETDRGADPVNPIDNLKANPIAVHSTAAPVLTAYSAR